MASTRQRTSLAGFLQGVAPKAAALLGGMALAAVAAAAAIAGEWREQPHPLISDREEILEDVAAVSARDVWAVGRHWGFIGPILEFRTHVLHWDGVAWTHVLSANVAGAATNFLQSVAARSPTEVWAVGWFRRSGESARTLVERWDGSSWSIIDSPNPGPVGNYLEAVALAGPTEAWAVGSIYDLSVVSRPLALRWDGTAWAPVEVPVPAFCTERTYLTDVAARNRNKVIATGYCKTAAGEQGFILQWNGRRWKVAAGPEQIPASSMLNGAEFVSAREAWAVGHAAEHRPLILHWDGTAWTVADAPDAGASATLLSVDSRGPSNVWAVGLKDSSQPPFAGRLTMHWDGTAWSMAPAGDFGSLNGVAMAGGHAWAVGQNIDESLIVARRK